jgi:diguanylate cyclase (GGDEF)-like protein
MAARTPERVVLIWSQRGALIASLERSLTELGLRGLRAGAPPEAAVPELRPSAIVVDGVEASRWAVQVCGAMRDAGVSPRSIVVIAAAGDVGTLRAVLALGVSRFVEEPFTPGVLALQVAAAAHTAGDEGRDTAFASGGERDPRDGLTGLASRHTFLQRMGGVLERARAGGQLAAILYLDIDRFKAVNDALGHAAGDVLLRHVARILENQVRATDLVGAGVARADGDVSRIGGDEFTVLLSKVRRAEDAGDVARRILDAMKAPVLAEGYQVAATASIGIAVFPHDGDLPEALVHCADMAMYAAKSTGRGRYRFYRPAMGALHHRRLEVEGQLRSALEKGELEVHYQPRIDVGSDAISGAEALCRWRSRELGVVPPKEFIPIAEDAGLIVPLGAWVLETACTQLARWRRDGLPGLRISVNVSSRQFASGDLLTTVTDVLRKTGVEPHSLELEVTERLMLSGDESIALTLRDLRGIGVTIALDDFGTGYSSLGSITRYPLDVLKIDRSIAADVEANPAAASIVSSVVALARSLGLGIVAEGVDSPGQAHVLARLGCDEIQGFLVSPAVRGETFVDLIRNWRGLAHCQDGGDPGKPDAE